MKRSVALCALAVAAPTLGAQEARQPLELRPFDFFDHNPAVDLPEVP